MLDIFRIEEKFSLFYVCYVGKMSYLCALINNKILFSLMKKVFVFAAVAASLLCMTSCDKDTKKCWVVTATTKVMGVTVTADEYVWMSQNEVEAQIKTAEAQAQAAGVEFTATKKTASKYKNETDCLAQNVKK